MLFVGDFGGGVGGYHIGSGFGMNQTRGKDIRDVVRRSRTLGWLFVHDGALEALCFSLTAAFGDKANRVYVRVDTCTVLPYVHMFWEPSIRPSQSFSLVPGMAAPFSSLTTGAEVCIVSTPSSKPKTCGASSIPSKTTSALLLQ